MHTATLLVHVVAGVAGLLIGPLAMRQDARRFAAGHRTSGRYTAAYVVVVLLVCVSGSALVWLDRTDLWWLVPVSAATFALAVLARESARRRFRGWTHGYVHGLGGSYIAQVTALVVVALVVDGPVGGGAQLIPWLAPTAVGTVLIEVWRRRLFVPVPRVNRPVVT
ncbi:hypothetical protein [Actinophytocola sp.]|uniref:hypothetical protein n=1 Tax=Actinophytocola sp. TaxID=1872138 RepID=UPI003D6B8413